MWAGAYIQDAPKFWWELGLGMLGVVTAYLFIGYLLIFGVWIWAIVDTVSKSESWYRNYPIPVARRSGWSEL